MQSQEFKSRFKKVVVYISSTSKPFIATVETSQRSKSTATYSVETISYENLSFTPKLDAVSDFDAWCEKVENIQIDFEGKFQSREDIFGFDEAERIVFCEFVDAIEDYKEHQKEFSDAPQISKESAKKFLLLLKLLAAHKPKVHIDTKNGCFNIDMQTCDNGFLSTQVSDSGQVHYSYIAQNKKLFKITGTAKFKDSKDFLMFNKILQML